MSSSALNPFESDFSSLRISAGDGALPQLFSRSSGGGPSGRITLLPNARRISIDGTPHDDSVIVFQPDSQTIRVQFTGVEIRDFNISDVDFISFRGREGNDLFDNRTGLLSYAYGDEGNDRIYGGDIKDYLYGGDGEDSIFGRLGNDVIAGDGGQDFIVGGTGSDRMWGGAGDDFIQGNEGNDTIYGDAGNDEILGGSENDIIHGLSGNDRIDGQRGNDRLFGEAGDDTLIGRSGNDYLKGGHHNDTLSGGSGVDTLDGGSGDDQLEGGSGSDKLYGKSGRDVLLGGLGTDRLWGGADADVLLGGVSSAERDELRGESGNDHLLYFNNHRLLGGTSQDLRLRFSNRSSLWTETEILVINRGLQKLHDATGNRNLVVDYLTGEDLNLVKVASITGGATAVNFLTSETINNQTTWNREIRFSDWNENSEPHNLARVIAFTHEIAHNFDNDFELRANPHLRTSDFTSFLNRSGWRSSNPQSPDYARSQDGNWWYKRSAQFYRTYSTINPYEDWGTMWELFFDETAERPAPNSNLGRKLAIVESFIGRLA